jgi:carbon storage regulator
MLVLNRKRGEVVVIGRGENKIEVAVLGLRRGGVKLGITGPSGVPIHRREVFEAIEAAERAR